jgi:hypothetical protein
METPSSCAALIAFMYVRNPTEQAGVSDDQKSVVPETAQNQNAMF